MAAAAAAAQAARRGASIGGDGACPHSARPSLQRITPCPTLPVSLQYGTGWAPRQYSGLAEKLLWKSATLHGFFLLHYAPLWRRHLRKLCALLDSGALRVQVCGAACAVARGRRGGRLAHQFPG